VKRYRGEIFLICFLLLNFYGIFLFKNHLDIERQREKLDETFNDLKIIQARNVLKDLNRNMNQFNRLQAYCIKRVTPPIRMEDIQYCKDSSIKILGYNQTYISLKELSISPLKSEL